MPDAEAKLVWSPTSNIALYGQTADIRLWLSLGLTVGIGPDWTPSGEDDVLAELSFARAYGKDNSIAALTARRLWEMATLDGSDVVGLAPNIGRLAVGSRADVLVVGREGPDPYDTLIDSDARDVRLVLVDGVAYYGDLALEASTAVNDTCEDFDACGVCAKGLPPTGPSTTTSRTTETSADVEMQLVDRLSRHTGAVIYCRSRTIAGSSCCPTAQRATTTPTTDRAARDTWSCPTAKRATNIRGL